MTDVLWKSFALIGFGLAFAMIGIGHIGLSVARHTHISDAVEWTCLIGFALSTLSGILLTMFEAIKVMRRQR